MSLKQLNETEISRLADDALDAACLTVQNAIGQTDGGVAGIFFSGANGDRFKAMMRAYIEMEYSMDNA